MFSWIYNLVIAADAHEDVAHSLFTIDRIKEFAIENASGILLGIFIFVIGRFIGKFARDIASRMMNHANYDKAANSFIGQIIYYSIIIIAGVSALSAAGFPTTSLITAFGAVSLAVGLALQNNLSNLASGLLILIFRPFHAGDWVSINDIAGTVSRITLMNTVIVTKQNSTVFIPNSIITSNRLTNSSYTAEQYIQFIFGIAYENDHHEAIRLIKEVMKEEPRVLNPDHLEIGIKEFGDNSVNIVAYPLVHMSEYWPVYYRIMSAVKDKFDAHGISIPYPQRDIHMHYPNKE